MKVRSRILVHGGPRSGDCFSGYSSGVLEEDREYQLRCRLKGRKSVVGLEEEADQYIDIRSGVDRKVV